MGMLGLSILAGSLLLASGVQAQADCSSLRGAINSYATQTAHGSGELDKSISTFNSLLDLFKIDNTVISQFGSANVLVPTDRAFVNLVSQVGGPDVDPLAFVMSHPNTFKQIVLYHFTGRMNGPAGEAHTALEAMERLGSFIDTSAICGREDSKHIKIQFKEQQGAYSLTEPVAKHFTANTVDSICSTDAVTVTTIDEVLTPCPHSMMFPGNLEGEFGCMSVAMAASNIENHPFGTLPYEEDASPVVANLKHPNLLASADSSFTVFVPTAEALESSGVTKADFLAVPGALDHVVKGHVAQQEVCIGGQVPATPVPTLADEQFCSTEGTLTMVAGAPNSLQVVSDAGAEASTTATNNIAVCGGLAHVVDAVLLPCEINDYSANSATQTEAGPGATPGIADRSAASTDATGSVASGAVAVATGCAAVAAAAAGLLL